MSAISLRAVLFDLDGTLRHSRPGFFQTFFEIAERLGAPQCSESRRKGMRWLHYYWAQSPELAADSQRFPGLPPQFWAIHATRMLLAAGTEQAMADALGPPLAQEMAEVFKPNDWVAPDVLPTLDLLRASGYCLAVVSNRDKPYVEQLERLELAQYFEFSLAAGEVDSWKPDRHIFEQALQRLGVQPAEAVYVGDNYYADVLGASAAGMKPVLFDPGGLFPEASCPVITSIGDLPEWLAQQPAP